MTWTPLDWTGVLAGACRLLEELDVFDVFEEPAPELDGLEPDDDECLLVAPELAVPDVAAPVLDEPRVVVPVLDEVLWVLFAAA